MIDFQSLREQMKAFGDFQLSYNESREEALQDALRAYEQHKHNSVSWAVPSDTHEKLVALPITDDSAIDPDPAATFECAERATPMTVVASDGSQIYPDRHIEPLCYLLNVSRIAFHYGTREAPLLASRSTLCFRGQSIEDLDDEVVEVTGRDVVSALRDELELTELLETAQSFSQQGRPLLAMADGTLIRWMLRKMQNPDLESRLLHRYVKALLSFSDHDIPMCSYISMPANKEFIRLLMHQVYGDAREREQRIRDLNDGALLRNILPAGARSAVFKSKSKVLDAYDSRVHVCFFYVHVGVKGVFQEVARVEIPYWVAQNKTYLEQVHATVLSEAEKGNGYPMILSEAHEQAVVRAPERALFYQMIEEESIKQGRPPGLSLKKRSKDQPGL